MILKQMCIWLVFIQFYEDQRICIKAPAHSTALLQAFLTKHRITQVCQHPYNTDLALCDSGFSES
jgi:hypothetical protein